MRRLAGQFSEMPFAVVAAAFTDGFLAPVCCRDQSRTGVFWALFIPSLFSACKPPPVAEFGPAEETGAVTRQSSLQG